MSEFESAVSTTRGGSANTTKAYPDAAAGSLGGFPAGPTESYSAPSGFDAAVSATRQQANVTPNASSNPTGLGSGMDSGVSSHAYAPGTEFVAGASATRSGEAQRAKSWSDAAGGGLGKS
jgi:hypothetical protein